MYHYWTYFYFLGAKKQMEAAGTLLQATALAPLTWVSELEGLACAEVSEKPGGTAPEAAPRFNTARHQSGFFGLE